MRVVARIKERYQSASVDPAWAHPQEGAAMAVQNHRTLAPKGLAEGPEDRGGHSATAQRLAGSYSTASNSSVSDGPLSSGRFRDI